MRRFFLPLMAVSGLALAACSPAVPESGAVGGVGFGDYQTYLKQREAALNNGTAMPGAPLSQATVANAGAAIAAEPVAATSLGGTSPSAPLPASILAAVPGGSNDGAAAVGAPMTASPMLAAAANASPMLAAAANASPMQGAAANATPNTANTSAAAPLPLAEHGAGISDENNFDAVAARETIASDKERLAAMRSNYQQVAPTDLPSRSGNTGPNLASYALAAKNGLGQSVYPRGGVKLSSSKRACEKFGSPDLAQTAFLNAGGPQKDGKNLDPDGDGFACSWDPTPFQAARAQ